jgi:predicted Holliday junction resolvase-like endonuclease
MKNEKKIWFLTIVAFILILVLWQIFYRIFPKREKIDLKNEELFSTLINKFEEFSKKIKEIKFSQILKEINQQPSTKLTNEEIEKLKERVLEYVNSSINKEKYEEK